MKNEDKMSPPSQARDAADMTNVKKSGRKSFVTLLDSNRFCFIFSLVVAAVIWLVVSMYASPVVTRTVSNVKVQINITDDSTPSKLGLQIFGQTDYYVDVNVTGKKYLVSDSALTANDIVVTASTSYVSDAGKNTLKLKAEMANSNSDVTINSMSAETIDVYFDTLKEQQNTLEADVRYTVSSDVTDGYILDQPILSLSSVTLSGPATEINKVSRVVARVTTDKPPVSTQTYDAEIIPLDADGGTFNYITVEADKVTVTLPVKKIVDFTTAVTFEHSPLDYTNSSPLTYKVSPSKVTLAVPTSDTQVDSSTVSVGKIDFNSLDNTVNTFTFSAANMSYTCLDAGVTSFTVTVDLSSMSKSAFSSISLGSISITNAPEGKKISVTSTALDTVYVVGPSSSISSLTADGLYVEMDLSNADLANGANTVPVRVYAKGKNDCWVYGSYSVGITVADSTEA